ncbi:hypothetical protein CAI21_10515 [Alkalilimnicola ehrlichii]|uniref:Outer membrane protein beta-barrel domain-containing protein n=1 Tax=Alkalilimnicola ehrlichii TaxID=351052 RepID=A0A3E0WT08_9GAMM|nr:hypothetical protein CAI21_10515 [Alkalilimnicola ehrlichii]RFA36104.1 hypothetical protein CAL65_11655 [Alkalilimnicola ehrlichii]
MRRSPRGPDSDRVILATGLSWTLMPRFTLDAAYTYTHFRDSDINNRENPAGTYHRLEGEYSGHIHSLGLQANYRF